METAFTAVLNGFHSLYDSIEKSLGTQPIDWYGTPALAFILAIRNARHHNIANKIRGLYTYHVQTTTRATDRVRYVLVDFAAQDPDASTFEFYISWSDIDRLLTLPSKETRLRKPTGDLVRAYLHAHLFPSYALKHGVDLDKLFINAVPLVVDAANTIVPLISGHLRAFSDEGEIFRAHFSGGASSTRTAEHKVDVLDLALPA
jgi:hypothetical protein